MGCYHVKGGSWRDEVRSHMRSELEMRRKTFVKLHFLNADISF